MLFVDNTKAHIQQKYVDTMELVFKMVYLFHILLCANIYYYGTVLNTISSALVLISGAIIICYRLLNYKEFVKYPFIWWYVFFICSYVVSTLVNVHYGLFSNIKILIWMSFFFFILFLFDKKKDSKTIQYELKVLGNELCLIATITSAIAIWMLFSNFCTFHTTSDGKTFLVGVASWGRLYGIVSDPNYAAVISVVAIILAIGFFIKSKQFILKIIYLVSIVLNMSCLVFSASRTGLVTLCVCIVCFTVLYVLNDKKSLIKAILMGICACFIVLAANKMITYSYNTYIEFKAEQIQMGDDIDSDLDSEILVEIGREEELEGDISNRRFDLWINALQIFQKNPFVGISFGGIVSYCEAELQDAYLLTNGFAIFDAFHNMFMDLLASQGIIGSLIFIGIIFCSLKYLFMNINVLTPEDTFVSIVLFSICLGIVVSSLFVSEILYIHNQTTVVFWMFWGYLLCICNKNVEQNKRRRNETCN